MEGANTQDLWLVIITGDCCLLGGLTSIPPASQGTTTSSLPQGSPCLCCWHWGCSRQCQQVSWHLGECGETPGRPTSPVLTCQTTQLPHTFLLAGGIHPLHLPVMESDTSVPAILKEQQNCVELNGPKSVAKIKS